MRKRSMRGILPQLWPCFSSLPSVKADQINKQEKIAYNGEVIEFCFSIYSYC
jgi:hypothetical protein